MRRHTKAPLLVLGALFLLALAVSSASARNFSVTEQRFTIRWSSLEFTAAVGTNRCPVTLAGSFHRRTLAKTAVLIGAITGATLNYETCTGGSATVLNNTLPWHIRYVSFTGTLPTITRIRVAIVGAAIQNNIGGTTCLYRTDAAEPGLGEINIGAGGAASTLDADETAEIDLEDDRFLCATAGDSTFSGRASLQSSLGGVISVRLI